MADYISMKQVPGGTVTAVDDRILYDVNLNSGVIYGCEISYQGNNMIHINAGYGVIKGGLFEMEDHTEYVEYAEDEPTTGQIYLKFDAAAVDKLVIVKETTNSLHPLEQDEDANYDSGVYEIQLCTFTATTTALTDVTQTFPIAEGAVDVLDSLTDIMANTDSGKAAGALAVKELNTNLVAVEQELSSLIKVGTHSGTTTQSGNMQIPISGINYTILAVYADGRGIICLPYQSTDKTAHWIHVITEANNVLGNTPIQVKYLYIANT